MKSFQYQLLFLFLFIFISSFNKSESKLTVISPADWVSQFTSSISSSYANYGKVPYGFTTRGNLYYNTNKTKDINYACDTLDLQLNHTETDTSYEYYPIVLIEQGNCSFVQMTRNVQRSGGSMALRISSTAETGSEIKEIQVNADGTENDINIPTLLISQNDGKKLSSYITQIGNSDNIMLEVEFKIKKADKPKVEIVLHSTEKEAYSFWENFYEFYNWLKYDISYEPHFISFEISGLSEREKEDNCVSKGAYCMAAYPTSDNNNGKYLIWENIFQHCVYWLSSDENNTEKYTPDLFFIFAKYYNHKCDFASAYKSQCGAELLTEYNLSLKHINKCIANSFGEETLSNEVYNNNENSYLEKELTFIKSRYLTQFPTIIVNNKQIHGRWNAVDAFQIICNSFNNKPQSCKDYFAAPVKETSLTGLSWLSITLIVWGVLLINILIVVLCRKYIVKRVHERIEINELDLDGRINAVVTNYFALKEPSEGLTKIGDI